MKNKYLVFILVFAVLFSGGFGLRISPFNKLEKSELGVAWAAASLVQTSTALTGGNGGTSITATFNASVATGSLLIAIGGAMTTSTLSMASDWNVAINVAKNPSQAIFYKIATSSAQSTNVTMNSSVNIHLGLHIYEYGGIDGTYTFLGSASSSGNGTTLNSGAITSTTTDVLFIAGLVMKGETSMSAWTNSFTERADFAQTTGTSGGRGTYAGADRIATSTLTNASTTATAAPPSNLWVGQLAAFKVKHTLNQSAYRWFDNGTGTSVGPPLAGLNAAATAPGAGTPFRLRMLLHVGDAPMYQSHENLKIQVSPRSGTCDTSFTGEAYVDIATSTGQFRFYDNGGANDGDALTATSTDPTHGGDPIVDQTFEESNPFTNSVSALSRSEDGKWDFSLINNSASSGIGYCFRAVRSSGSLLDTYTQIPELVVGNFLPSLGILVLNGNADIDSLIEGQTSTIKATTTITDENGYGDITSVTGRLYRSGVGNGCSANNNNCYVNNSCTLSSCSGSSCTATCNYDVWYFADPTDTSTTWESENWISTMRATDSQSASTTATSSAVEMLSLVALSVTSPINYGNLSPGTTLTPLTPSTTLTSTGNVSLDAMLYGIDMTAGSGTIPVGQQRYATGSVPYASGTALLASPGVELELNLPKITSTSSLPTSTWRWGIQIPNPQPTGGYTGMNTFVGVRNELPW